MKPITVRHRYTCPDCHEQQVWHCTYAPQPRGFPVTPDDIQYGDTGWQWTARLIRAESVCQCTTSNAEVWESERVIADVVVDALVTA